MAKTAEESHVDVVAASYAMKYTEVVRQSQQKLLYDLFRPTWLSSGNTHSVRITWEEIINIKYNQKK